MKMHKKGWYGWKKDKSEYNGEWQWGGVNLAEIFAPQSFTRLPYLPYLMLCQFISPYIHHTTTGTQSGLPKFVMGEFLFHYFQINDGNIKWYDTAIHTVVIPSFFDCVLQLKILETTETV